MVCSGTTGGQSVVAVQHIRRGVREGGRLCAALLAAAPSFPPTPFSVLFLCPLQWRGRQKAPRTQPGQPSRHIACRSVSGLFPPSPLRTAPPWGGPRRWGSTLSTLGRIRCGKRVVSAVAPPFPPPPPPVEGGRALGESAAPQPGHSPLHLSARSFAERWSRCLSWQPLRDVS